MDEGTTQLTSHTSPNSSLSAFTSATSSMTHLPSLLILLLVFLQVMPKASSEICYKPICRYTLEVSMQFSHIYNVTPSIRSYYDVDLEPGTDTLRIINSTFRTGVEDPIGQAVPNPLDVITLDGVRRTVYTINGQFPGPVLEFTQGSQVEVTVINKLADEDLTIHWHGFPQEQNAWFDGVPELTQCPITPGGIFTYRLNAPHVGTFWYHSHVGYQRQDGLSGMIIIHPKLGPTLPYFPVMVQDWYHKTGSDYFFSNPLATPAVPASGLNLWASSAFQRFLVDGTDLSIVGYVSGLIDGRGRFNGAEKWPLTKFQVQRFKTYQFHITHAGAESPLQVSVDSHKLILVGVDSEDIQRIVVDSVIIYTGERVIFELEANQPNGRYWFRSILASDSNRDGFIGETLAILEYERLGTDDEPTTDTKLCTASDHCTVFNCPFKYYPESFYSDCIYMADARRTYASGEHYKYGLNKLLPDEEYFINFRFFRGATFNAKVHIPPTSPVYQTDSESVICKDCPDDDVCHCTFIIDLAYNKVIQFVVSNIQVGGVNAHPVHFHGHLLAVVRQGFPDYEYLGDLGVTPEIDCQNDVCNNARWAGGVQPTLNLQDPPLKDTVVVAAGGYTVVRFRSDNPGPWLVHCHMAHHVGQGPMVLLIMSARERFPPIPVRTPTCTHNFTLSDSEYETYFDNAQKSLITGKGFQKVSPHFTIPKPPPVPSPSPPPPHFPVPEVNEGKVVMTVGGVVGTVVAAFLGGVLITVVIILICRCCCSCRMPMDRHHSHRGKNALVVPSTPAYIGAGPMATYGVPIKPALSLNYY